MKQEQLLEAISDIDEAIVERASDALEGKRRLHNLSRGKKLGLIAACLAVVLAVVGIFSLLGGDSPIDIFNSDEKKLSFGFGAMAPEAPDYPWDDSYYLKASMDTNRYAPGERAKLKIEAALKNDFLGQGDLLIMLENNFFTIACDGGVVEDNHVVLTNFTIQRYAENTPANPVIELEWEPVQVEHGTIHVYVFFIPADMELFWQQESVQGFLGGYEGYLPNDGYVPLANFQLHYAANVHEVRFAASSSQYGVLDEMLSDQLKAGKISQKEYVDLLYADDYADHICAARSSYHSEKQTMTIMYISKNIRYHSDRDIADEELWQLSEQMMEPSLNPTEEEKMLYRTFAKKVLAWMLANGVITQAEYDQEIILVEEAETVDNFEIATPPRKNESLFRKYRYTHQDP